MIAINSQARAIINDDADFTILHYRDLLRIARDKWPFTTYQSVPFGSRFLLWRHDCDYSLNRALALARVEHEEGVKATYCVNPHSEFYNLLERGQLDILHEIRALGHDVALHFDSMFYATHDEAELVNQLESEASLLEKALGIRPAVFSFHNPSAFHLSCEEDSYAGMLNCYSRRFKKEVAYCSDSNGYWRFQRLHDVLIRADETSLQVLTHPGWWQDEPMTPREKVFRSVYGRAEATISFFYKAINEGGRENPSGVRCELAFLQLLQPRTFSICDYLWNSGHLRSLFVELWRLHEGQINKLCKAVLRKEWQVPASEVNAFFEDNNLAIDGWQLFAGVFGSSWQDASGVSGDVYQEWVSLRNQLIHGRGTAPKQRLEEGCVYLCGIIAALAAWGKAQSIAYDGLVHLGTIGLPTCKTADGSLTDRLEELSAEIPNFPTKKWERFKADMAEVGAGGTAA
jgi:hypothetical protein